MNLRPRKQAYRKDPYFIRYEEKMLTCAEHQNVDPFKDHLKCFYCHSPFEKEVHDMDAALITSNDFLRNEKALTRSYRTGDRGCVVVCNVLQSDLIQNHFHNDVMYELTCTHHAHFLHRVCYSLYLIQHAPIFQCPVLHLQFFPHVELNADKDSFFIALLEMLRYKVEHEMDSYGWSWKTTFSFFIRRELWNEMSRKLAASWMEDEHLWQVFQYGGLMGGLIQQKMMELKTRMDSMDDDAKFSFYNRLSVNSPYINVGMNLDKKSVEIPGILYNKTGTCWFNVIFHLLFRYSVFRHRIFNTSVEKIDRRFQGMFLEIRRVMVQMMEPPSVFGASCVPNIIVRHFNQFYPDVTETSGGQPMQALMKFGIVLMQMNELFSIYVPFVLFFDVENIENLRGSFEPPASRLLTTLMCYKGMIGFDLGFLEYNIMHTTIPDLFEASDIHMMVRSFTLSHQIQIKDFSAYTLYAIMYQLESSTEEIGHVAVAIQIKLGVWQLFDNEVSIRVEQQDLFYLDVLKQRLGWTYDLAYATAAFYVPTEMFARSSYTEMEEKEFVKHAYWIK